MNCFDKQINNEQLAAIAAAEIPFEFTNQLKTDIKTDCKWNAETKNKKSHNNNNKNEKNNWPAGSKLHLPSKQQQFFIKMKIAANCQAMCVIKGRGGGGKWLEALSGGRTDCVDLAPGSLKCQLHCKLWS